jgi:hypothetical protein
MKNVIKLEELMMFAGSAYLLYFFQAEWWVYVLLFLGPDISMLAYAAGNKAGAIAYNIFHHKGIAVVIFLIGFYFGKEELILAGIILFGHSSMDRFFGYGLKYFERFQTTHLGKIGNTQTK